MIVLTLAACIALAVFWSVLPNLAGCVVAALWRALEKQI